MNPETFDNDDPATTDEDYFAFAAWLFNGAAGEFRRAKGNAGQERVTLCRYYKRGLQANLTMSELMDFLAVSAESVLEVAGYTDEESIVLMVDASDHLTQDEIMLN